MGIKAAKACGVFFGATVLGAGLGAAAGTGIDYYKGEHRDTYIQEAATNVTSIKNKITNSDRHKRDIQKYGDACMTIVAHYSPGGVLQDKPEDVAVANIAGEPGSPCGTSKTEVLVAYNDIFDSYAQTRVVKSLNYEGAAERLESLTTDQNNDNDFTGLFYVMGVGTALGAARGAYRAKETVDDMRSVGL